MKTVRHVHSFVRNPYRYEGQPKWYCGLCGMPKPGEPFEGKQGPDRLVEEATEFVKRPKVQLEVSMGQRVKES